MLKVNRNRCLIIAEAGVNHNGRLELALQLCDKAKECGADVIKFQTWKTERIITKTVAQAAYQETNTGVSESQFDMLKKLELSYEDFKKIKHHCEEIGLLFASTGDDEESLDFLIELKVPFIKISSGEIGNVPFLRHMGRKKTPIIMSTGMSSMTDVAFSLKILKECGADDITILHCTTNYPCSYEDVNLKAMLTLRDTFNLPVGYSDHTMGIEVAVAAVALGAKVIEKHFTLDCGLEGPDHAASIEPKEFTELVKAIRHVERSLGNGIKEPTDAEKEIAKVVTKRIVAARHIEKGEMFSDENICVKRNDVGIEALRWDEVIGKTATNDFEIDEGIILKK